MTRRTIEIAAFFAALLLAASAFHAWLASRDDQQRLQATLSAQQKIIASADTNERARNASLADALAQIEKLKRASQTPQQIAAALQNDLSLPRPLALGDSKLAQSVTATLGRPGKTRKGTVVSDVSHPSAPLSDDSASNASRATDSVTQPRPGRVVSDPTIPFVNGCPTATPCGTNLPPASTTLPSFSAANQSQPGMQDVTCPSVPGCTVQIPAGDLKPLYNYVQDCRECRLRLAAANENLAADAKKLVALTSERDAAITAAKGGTLWRRVRRNFFWFAVGAAAATAYAAKH